MEFRKHPERNLKHILSAPIIWSVIIPIVIADIWVEIYHRICFPLYGIPLIKRSEYIRIDRYKLSKLSFMERLNCVYCQYVNNWINYVQKIAGATEKYWCGIKQNNLQNFFPPDHQKDFDDIKNYE
ncbi:MAG: hypothetical protein Fur0024_4040 [Patescibacteria group bacterium]